MCDKCYGEDVGGILVKELESAPALAAIRCRGLRKVYPGGTVAVQGLDLDIARGEFFGLLGPNGAGKTTTVGMLTTRTVPTGGDVWIGGLDVRKQAVAVKRIIGVVTQFNTLDRRLTAWENLYYHGRYFGMSGRDSRQEADRILDLVRLRDRAKEHIESLSGGMQQRLLIGRALVHHPEVLFLDEPTTGIDPQGRLALWEILLQLHDEGQTVLLTTHYMDEAERLCQRIAVMDRGVILALGSADELKRTVGAETIVTLHAEPVNDGLIAALRNVPQVRSVEAGPRGLQVFAGASSGLVAQVAEAAVRSGVELKDLSVSNPTLETVFIKLTGRELRE